MADLTVEINGEVVPIVLRPATPAPFTVAGTAAISLDAAERAQAAADEAQASLAGFNAPLISDFRAEALSSDANPTVLATWAINGIAESQTLSWLDYLITVDGRTRLIRIRDQSIITGVAGIGNSQADITEVTNRWPQRVAAALGVPIESVARYSSDLRQPYRLGAAPLLLTVEDDTLPATGDPAKAVTAINGNAPSNDGINHPESFLNTSNAGVVSGMSADGFSAGRAVRVSITDGAALDYKVIQTTVGAEALPLDGPVLFTPAISLDYVDKLVLIELGNNAFYSGVPGYYGDHTSKLLFDAYDVIVPWLVSRGNRIVILPITPDAAWGTNTSQEYLAMAAANARLAAKYPDYFVPGVLAALQAAGNGSPEDDADIAAGFVPRSVRVAGDTLHLDHDGAGEAAKAARVDAFLATQTLPPAAPEDTTITLAAGDDIAVTRVRQGALALKADAADFDQVDNTSDADKPVSTAQSAAILSATTGLVSLARFGIANGGSEVSAAIQNAIIAAKSGNEAGIFIPPGIFGIDVGSKVIVPTGFTVAGVYGRSILKGLGTAFASTPAFPLVGQALLAVGDPATGNRYGTETSRRAIGAGATFNLTVSSGAVTAASVASGGAGYRIGDKLLLANGTTLFVTSLAGSAVSGVVVGLAGSGWGAPANPYGHTNATGQNNSDRVFNTATFADDVHFRDLVLDGGYGFGNALLTGAKKHYGIDARGVLNFSARGLIMRRFPNTALNTFDVKNARITDNFADDCGWTGVFSTSRNGYSNVGLYSVSQPTINTEFWEFERNVARKIGDVGAQFAFVENHSIKHNKFLGCGTIAIEGEASNYACWQTYAGNNGVRVPGSGTISDNLVDGLMLDGTLATDTTSSFNPVAIYGLNGISWGQGNEGEVVEGRNVIQNLTGTGLRIIRNSGGKITGLGGTVVKNVNQGNNAAASPVAPGYAGATQPTGAALAAATQRVFFTAAEVTWKRNHVYISPKGEAIYVSPLGGFVSADVTDNYCEGSTGDFAPAIRFRTTRAGGAKFLDFSRNRGDGCQAEFLLVEVSGAGNATTFIEIRADDISVRNANRGNVAGTAVVKLQSPSSGQLGANIISVDRLHYYETSLSSNTTVPVIMSQAAASAPALVSISDMVAPQFATKSTIAGMAPAPSATRLVNNV